MPGPDDVGNCTFVFRIQKGKQKTNRNGLDLSFLQEVHQDPRAFHVQGTEFLPLGTDALGDLSGQIRRNEQGGAGREEAPDPRLVLELDLWVLVPRRR